MVQLNSFYISPPMAHTEQMFYTYAREKENEKFMEVLMKTGYDQDYYKKGNNLKLYQTFKSLKNPEASLLILLSLLNPHVDGPESVSEKLGIPIGELEAFLYQPSRN